MVSNKEISKILYEIGEYLEIKKIPFKPRAYEKAAYSIGNLEEEVFEIYKKKVVRDINNRKLVSLYSGSNIWHRESIFTVYR